MKNYRTRLLSKISYIIGISLIISSVVFNLFPSSLVFASSSSGIGYKLNLSHIYCVNEQVEVHFVLLNVPDGQTPGTLTYNYGSIPPTSRSGNAWHFFDYKNNGHYDIESASVEVGGINVTLDNPGVYSGDYICGSTETPTSTATQTETPRPTRTLTKTAPKPSKTPTSSEGGVANEGGEGGGEGGDGCNGANSSMESSVFSMIISQRSNAGLGPLQSSSNLMSIARS
ncbi:MAG: hypothetical protein CVU45_06315, partial [Chloroflexi bacterium HGW-Chloroflexi-7]